jgi:LPXTG-motif cell wall-anchored protein
MRRLSLVLLAFLFICSAELQAAPGLLVGVTEDGLKSEPEAALEAARELGIGAFRITLRWRPGLTSPTPEQSAELDRATGGASGVSIVLSVFGERAVHAPTTEDRRDQYCSFLQAIVRRYDRIRYVSIWNEPNKEFFWRPQFNTDGTSAVPGAYAALLARCWDVLHEVSKDVRLIAPSTSPRGNDNPNAVSNVSHSPTLFVRELGRAYRESGREAPIFDVVGHHVHGIHSAERPWRTHPGSTVTQGDLGKLEQALAEAFSGSAQPVPGRCVDDKCVPVWFLEAGYQTIPDGEKAELYTGLEVTPRSLPDATGDVNLEPLPDSRSPAPDQSTQIVSALHLAYCQPHVEAFFNFLLWDEPRLEGWQSAPYWTDRTPKGSHGSFRDAISDVRDGDVECGEMMAAVSGSSDPVGEPPETDGSSPWVAAAAGAGGILVAGVGLLYALRRRRSRAI